MLENTPREVIAQALRHIVRRIGRGPGLRLLDYGCGIGEFSRVAQELGLHPVGIEQDVEARSHIDRESLFPVYPDLETLQRNAPDSRFDLIVLWQVIEHLRRPWEDLGRLKDMLAEDGWLVAATANADSLKRRVLGAHWEHYVNLTHFYYFTPQSMRAAFQKAGFFPVEQWRWNMVYPHHGPLRRALQLMLKAARQDGDLFFAGRNGGTGTVSAKAEQAA